MNGQMGHDEIAVHGIHSIFGIVTNERNARRTVAKLVFLEELGFLFTFWSVHKAPSSQEALDLLW